MLSQQADMMQFVVMAGFERASGHAAVTDRLGAITLYAQMLIDTRSHELHSRAEAFPHLHLAPPARVASNLGDARALLRHWSRVVL